MSLITIYSVPNGVGISRDLNIITNLLKEEGYEFETQHCFMHKPTKKSKYNIFLERFNPPLLKMADTNILIPNQEWFEDSWHVFLPYFKYILTKTNFATDIFSKLKCDTRYIGFTSEDRYVSEVKKDMYNWLHIAGKSIQKQTDIVFETWVKNPGFPPLTIIQDIKHYKQRTTAKNVNLIHSRMTEDVLKSFQNSSMIHVCPSETEGFGHYIMEALSCQSVVLTTNASPMTELVQKETGLYVDVVKQERMRLSLKNIISVETLEKAVININITEEQELVEMGKRGREFYLNNDKSFKIRFKQIIKDIIKG